MLSYLKNRSQRVNVNKTFSSRKEIIVGFTQGSILGPLLFDIFINGILLCENKAFLRNYANDKCRKLYGSQS